MKALVFDFHIPRLAAARVLGTLSPRGYLTGLGPLVLRDVPEPSLPGDDWVIVETRWCGICGSDVKQVFHDGATDNPLTSLISFPHVMGHELSGIVVEVGRDVKRVARGDRVACYPWLSCAPRGLPLCSACHDGRLTHCERFADGALAPGIHVGNCRDVPGGFGARSPMHESMVFRVPDGVELDVAALADPFSVALRAVLMAPPEPGDRVAVVGCGTLGLLAIHVLARLFDGVEILAIDVHPHVRDLAMSLGATRFTTATGRELIEEIGQWTESAVRKPWAGLPWLPGGVARVYDTVGSARTLETAVRYTRPQGTVVMVGVSTPARFEWTPLYFKEVRLVGSSGCGIEHHEGRKRHAFEIFLELVANGRVSPERILTHTFGLSAYRDAFLVARDKGRHRSVKVLVDPAG